MSVSTMSGTAGGCYRKVRDSRSQLLALQKSLAFSRMFLNALYQLRF